MADTLFSGLLDHSFKGVSFPTTQFTLDIRHDLAIHKMVDKDGAEIEGTGRAPLQFTARIPFINGLQKGPHELWESPLYPNAFRQFIDATADRATGPLNHPEFGTISVKTEHVHVVWDGEKQGGVYVDVTWIETVLNAQDVIAFLGGTSPVAQIAEAAALIDSQMQSAAFTVPSIPANVLAIYKQQTSSASFTDFANSIRAISDLPSLMNQQIGGRIDGIVANTKTLGAALDTISSPLNWLLFQSLQKILQAANGLRQTILEKKRAIGLFPVQVEGTLANLATQIQQGTSVTVNVGDLFILNPSMLKSPVVPQGSTVRFYAS